MKWLLASISKGKDVSDFYPHVVKLVGAVSLEVRKMVYMYLVQYADHDDTTRNLSLLSINAFQKGLSDSEQLIRALALRVLSSIRINDILQIQILNVQKCATDSSPYVRKCAANALAKLVPRCDDMQREMMFQLMKEQLLDRDTSTMVLTSVLVAFSELCPDRLELLHASYRKICHLLTDMDEWGQVVVIDIMTRYCRKFFKEPKALKQGAAELIDQDRRGFYSDEEDDSTDEGAPSPPISTATTQPLTLTGYANADPDLQKLDPDHQLLLASSMPLLKSRNAGVVLAVCSLHYYCGVSSIKSRSAIGKSLVRIHRGRREIQYVVLTSIRVLVRDCPSAFAPFLRDFFVKALDPPFTRLIKIDILVSLALEPAAIEAVLNELRSYIRHGDKTFATASIRAVGRVVEMTKIVFDRHGESNGKATRERQAACRVALDALYGLSVVTQVSESRIVVGESISVMQSIIQMLNTAATLDDGSSFAVDDPNQVRAFAMRRILLLLANSLSNRQKALTKDMDEDSDDDEENVSDLQNLSIDLKPAALSSALWIVGEWMTVTSSFDTSMQGAHDISKVREELLRLIDICFPYFTLVEKEQAIHFASKIWVSCVSTTTATPATVLCEHILAMGRLDVNPDVKDRARFESSLLHTSVGLKHDTSGIDERPGPVKLNLGQAKSILFSKKPTSSYLPIESESIDDATSFRFGTLSSLVGHKARGPSTSLPPWAKKNSPAALREPIEVAKQQLAKNFSDPVQAKPNREVSGFYDDVGEETNISDDSSDSDSSSSSSESSDSSSDDSDSDSDSDDDSSSSSNESDNVNQNAAAAPSRATNANIQNNLLFQPMQQNKPSIPPSFESNRVSTITSDDSSESDDESSSDESSSDESGVMPVNNFVKPGQQGNFSSQSNGEGNLLSMTSTNGSVPNGNLHSNSISNTMEDLKGLVMEPIKVQKPKMNNIDFERDSSAWIHIVRPELCGGLSVKARYLRGPSKNNQLQLANINPSNTNTICIQLEFINKKPDSTPIRRIKVMPRSGSSGTYAVKKTLCPPEIMELKANGSIYACLIFEFASMSNRDGDIVGRIDVKQGYGGSIPIEFKPSLSELLQPPEKILSVQEFDATMTRMQGFQRVESSFKTSLPIASVPQAVIKNSSFQPIGDATFSSDKKLRMIGLLPENKQPVMVKIEVNKDGGKIVVCCDHVVATNSILSVVKRSISP
eukprot:jgi/Psemu1/221169/e_gw1.1098.11.1